MERKFRSLDVKWEGNSYIRRMYMQMKGILGECLILLIHYISTSGVV